MNKRKPNIKFFRVFRCRCYLLNDYEDAGNLKAKGDIEVFVGYSKESAAFRIYNKRTRESSSSSLNDDVQQSPKEDAYFDASTSFHDPSNVHTFYQPYPHEKKWTKDHPLHKIIGDPKSSVRIRGQLANSCLFSCLLSSINIAKAFRDADWVSAMQDELDQFARLKVWRLVPRPKHKTQNVYVGQLLGFNSKQYPDHVYALDKALYGLKQAPRAWYDVFSQFLIDSGFQKCSIDTTLFIKKKGK
nr:hypothetical protein [Tanacetum cinerariifolium]